MSGKKRLAVCVVFVVGMVQPATTLKAQRPQEGIKVHGHWAIDVRTPDGTLVTHTEFENALLGDGKSALAEALSQPHTPLWAVSFFTGDTNNRTLVLAIPIGGVTAVQQNGALTLTGSTTRKSTDPSGPITAVETHIINCEPGVSQADCLRVSGGHDFSLAALPTPLDVVPTQIIEVTVTISFS